MKHYFIINPAAGQGKAQSALEERIVLAAEKNGVDYEIYYTKCEGDAEDYVRQTCKNLNGEARFYACGGDGTFSEVANGAYGCKEAQITVVPVGTGNDFVRNFEHSELFGDIDAQINGAAEDVDVIKYNDRIVINMMNIGFDCYVAKTMTKIKRNKWVPRGFEYIAALVIEFCRKSGVTFSTLTLDGEEIAEKAFLLGCLGNGSFCGGGFKSAPAADLRDGELDMCLVRNLNLFKCLKIIGKYKAGTFLSDAEAMNYITYKKIKTARMTFGGEGQYVSFDGKIVRVKELEIEVAPLAVRVSLPCGIAACKKESECAAV